MYMISDGKVTVYAKTFEKAMAYVNSNSTFSIYEWISELGWVCV